MSELEPQSTQDSNTSQKENQNHQLYDSFQKALDPNDSQAKDDFVETIRPKIGNIVFYKVANQEDAEDLIQDALIRVYERGEQFKGNSDGQLIKWINTITNNLITDRARQLSRRKEISLVEPDQKTGADLEDQFSAHQDLTEPDFSGQLIEELSKDTSNPELIKQALANLPANQRDPIVKHYIDGKDLLTISRELGVREGTLKSRLSRGREAIRKKLPGIIVGNESKTPVKK